VNAIEQSDIFKNLPVHFVYGDKDQFLKDVNIEEKTAEFENMGMKLSVWPFEGKHVMDRPTLAKIVGSFDH
jgi:predicted esterase